MWMRALLSLLSDNGVEGCGSLLSFELRRAGFGEVQASEGL
jgi:hypothetical protein